LHKRKQQGITPQTFCTSCLMTCTMWKSDGARDMWKSDVARDICGKVMVHVTSVQK
jgi:hypothetical protein